MSETVVFPQLSGLNWPSFLLHALQTLYGLGVPEENIRIVPQMGHFAAPEIDGQDPPGPVYDPGSGRLIVRREIPEQVRPCLTLNVRAETLTRFVPSGPGGALEEDVRVVGRLAHFAGPLLTGLTGGTIDETGDPLGALTPQVCAAYPELLATISAGDREGLEAAAMALLASLDEPDEEKLLSLVAAGSMIVDPAARASCYAAWRRMADKLPAQDIPTLTPGRKLAAVATFRRWADLLFGDIHGVGASDTSVWTEMTAEEREEQRALLLALLALTPRETAPERTQIVREMLEIMATEAFTASAVIDALFGIGWVHGAISDFSMPADVPSPDGFLLSCLGGQNSVALVHALLQAWADEGPVLGVGRGSDDGLNTSALDDVKRNELWALAALRRDAADPLVLFETAVQRLIHPDAAVHLRRYDPVHSRVGTLLAQPGATAVLGGGALLQFPGVMIVLPMAEDADEAAVKGKAVLAVLCRLFLPVCCRAEVVWQEAVARLGETSYLKHEWQSGVRLAR